MVPPVKSSTKVTAKQQAKPRLKLLKKLLLFDASTMIKLGSKIIIGVDEVGRGCLAGPVVAAAAILPAIDLKSELALALAGINDSKQIGAQERERLAVILREHALHAIGSASVEEIDQINIYHASLLAMQRAVRQLLQKLSLPREDVIVLVDGKAKIPQLQCEQKSIVKGDGLSASIAAASIIAKVHRDQIMIELARLHPNYHWHSNKGYASSSHRQAIIAFGVNCWHRQAFIVKVLETRQQLELNLDLELNENFDS